jgi:hypothetical protein
VSFARSRVRKGRGSMRLFYSLPRALAHLLGPLTCCIPPYSFVRILGAVTLRVVQRSVKASLIFGRYKIQDTPRQPLPHLANDLMQATTYSYNTRTFWPSEIAIVLQARPRI